MQPVDLLADLDETQRAAVAHEAGALCVLAGPGSGKTRVLTRRVAYRAATGAAVPQHTAVVTFTRRAARELRERLVTLGVAGEVAAGTFHSLAYAQLRRRWADQGRAAPVVATDRGRLVQMAAGELGLDDADPDALTAAIGWAKARGLEPAGVSELDFVPRAGLAPGDLAAVYERYETVRRRRGVVDLDDLVLLCARAIEDDAEFAAAVRWKLRHVFVDEAQDINGAQLRLLRAWVGGRDDLTLVGDHKQSIYGWNGAESDLLQGVPEHFPGMAVTRLGTNHRSRPAIEAVSAAIASSEPAATRHAPGAPPTLTAYESEADEGAGIAFALRARSGRYRWADMAVLARTNADVARYRAALLAAGVPVRGAECDDGVDVTTFHQAKGLEWRAVVVAGLDRDADRPAWPVDEAEERRLAYVAVSRASDELVCTWARTRPLGAHRRRREPVPAVAEIEGALARLDGPLAAPEPEPEHMLVPVGRAARAPRSPSAARRGHDAGRELLVALSTWRDLTARASAVPAAAVIPDDTLAAIAAAPPGSSDDLVAAGLGAVKVARFGPTLLDLVRRHAAAS